MNKHRVIETKRISLRRAARVLTLLSIASMASAPRAAPPGVPANFQGAWVPAKAGCDASVRLRIAGDKLTLENGKDSEALGGIEMAGPGYFAPDYRGIMAVLITEFEGQQPATVTFNVGEKKGVARVDFSPVMPGKATPQLNAYNQRIGKLNLIKRFPLDKLPLKKCPGA